MHHGRYVAILAVLLAVLWTALAIAPFDRHDWLLENALLIVFVAGLAASARHFPLSRVSYTLIFLFLCLHTLGAHYTYSLVPYDRWWSSLTGSSLNTLLGWERNNFDRVVHFCYGLLLAYPVREVFLRIASVRPRFSIRCRAARLSGRKRASVTQASGLAASIGWGITL